MRKAVRSVPPGEGAADTAPFPTLIGGSLSRKQILQILAPPIAFHRCLVPVAGSVNAALMLSQALYWTPRTKDPAGWFYKSQKEWEEETGLSRSEQDIARKQLKTTGFWQERLKGVPATLYFCVDCEILQTRLLNFNILVCEKQQTRLRDPANITSSETTTETTKEETTTEETPIVPVGIWLSFVEMRNKIRRPLTPYAGELIRRKLAGFRQKGFDPTEIIEQSILNGWPDVYEPKGNENGQRESFDQQKRRREEKALSEVREGVDGLLQQMEDGVSDPRSLKAPDGDLLGSITKSVAKRT